MTPPNFDSIPQELKDIPNWVLWKLVKRKEKDTKVPYQVNGQKANSTNPDTWESYDAVKRTYLHSNGKFSGIGFVFCEDIGIMGIDWDEVKNGEWDQEAFAEIKSCDSYAEVSQSGTGAHVLIKGKLPSGRRRKDNIEMYSEGRFFAVTGWHIEGTPLEITENQGVINKLYAKRLGNHQDILSKIKDEKFSKLFNGDTTGYNSDSEADLALCSIIARYTQDEDVIDSIFRESDLYREKWDRNDYRKRTIAKALQDKIKKPQDRVKEYPEQIQEMAWKILREGDPVEFILDTYNIRHVGDRNLGENCLCAVASTYILNTEMGLHIKPSGESGKGKSDAIEGILVLLPAHKYITGSLSGKALFYDTSLKPGTIVYSDDANLKDDIVDTIKQSTSKFQNRTYHRTVKNQESSIFSIPERFSWWFSSVNGIGDEQLANRFLNADVDGSAKQDLNVLRHLQEKEAKVFTPIDDDVLICQCIFDILDLQKYVIKIPYAEKIMWKDAKNRRNFSKFIDIIRAVTLFKIFQREEFQGCYLAEYEDFERALKIYLGTSKNNATNLTELEIKVLKFIAEKNKYDTDGNCIQENPVSTNDLLKEFDKSQERMHIILHGRDGKGGMLAKVPNLTKIDRSITTEDFDSFDRTTTRMNLYVYTGKKIGLEIYDTVAVLDRKEAIECKEPFLQKLSKEAIASIVDYCSSIAPTNAIVKTTTVDRINNNITYNKKERELPSCGNCAQLETISHISSNCCNTAIESQMMVNPESSSNAIDAIESQPITDIQCNSSCDTVFEGDKVGNTVNLLRHCMIKFIQSEYFSVVDCVPALVEEFNTKYPGAWGTNGFRYGK